MLQIMIFFLIKDNKLSMTRVMSITTSKTEQVLSDRWLCQVSSVYNRPAYDNRRCEMIVIM